MSPTPQAIEGAFGCEIDYAKMRWNYFAAATLNAGISGAD
jgi:hypothetical protein